MNIISGSIFTREREVFYRPNLPTAYLQLNHKIILYSHFGWDGKGWGNGRRGWKEVEGGGGGNGRRGERKWKEEEEGVKVGGKSQDAGK